MAIELELRGDFDPSPALVRTLLGPLGSGAQVAANPRPDVDFEIVTDLLVVTALVIRGEGALFFRVRDKGRVVEAEDVVVGCVDAVLAATDAGVRLLFGGDRLLLERAGGPLTVVRTARKPEKDFWDGRTEMLHHQFRLVRKAAGPPPRATRRR